MRVFAVSPMQFHTAALGNINPEVRRVKIDVVDKNPMTIDCSVLFLLPHLSSVKQYQTFVQELEWEKAKEDSNPVPDSGGTMATLKPRFSTTTGGSMVLSQYCFLSQETENTMHACLPLIHP